MVHESLRASGKRVGSFTSPYVVAAIEKIQVDALYISPETFTDIVEELKPVIEKEYTEGLFGGPTYFEVFFAIALIYFKRQKCEWVLLEVGAGGRYDATNIVENPVVTAITSIDYDHVQILGSTLLSIADNKAGIIKKGSAFFTTEKRKALLSMFRRVCEEKGAVFTALPVVNEYQENNKTLARTICRYIGIREADIEKGLHEAKLPCRFEVVEKHPFVVLDGAHNRAKMRSTASNVRTMKFDALHLIIGIKEDKDLRPLLGEIVPLADSVYATSIMSPTLKSAPPADIARIATALAKKGAAIHIVPSAKDSYTTARGAAGPRDLILVTGSFYLAGELRTRWYPEEWVLKHRKSF
jgi:dihydrofolate synthase/folylpolyglutamate synthase